MKPVTFHAELLVIAFALAVIFVLWTTIGYIPWHKVGEMLQTLARS